MNRSDRKQYEVKGNILTLKVKKAPLFIRSILFLLCFVFVFLPTTGMIFRLLWGYQMNLAYLIFIFIFGLFGFYTLRIALWNTYGKESIVFHQTMVEYVADYGWFRDGKKQKEFDQPMQFKKVPLGYEEDDTGGLIIGLNDKIISCVTKMPNAQVDELIQKLEALNKSE